MPPIEREISINAPSDSVFGYLADFPRHGEWAAHQLRIEPSSQGPVAAGSKFTSVGHQLGRDNEDQLTVTEFVPGEKIVFECQGNAGHIRHYFLVRNQGEGTAVAKGIEPVDLRFPFSALFPLLQTFGAVGRGLDGDLQRIKARLEQPSG